MENTAGRAAAETWTASLRATLATLALSVAVLIFLSLTAERGDAMCCACLGGGSCGAGFCVDGVADPVACANLCSDASCTNTVYNSADLCDGGCGVATQLPTATPTATPSRTGTPTISSTPSVTPTPSPSVTRTATAFLTASATPTATFTLTPTITLTPSKTATVTSTPTPLICCIVSGPQPCVDTDAPNCILNGGMPAPTTTLGQIPRCRGLFAAAECYIPTPTNTPKNTNTSTPTRTPTWTPSETPTNTPTPVIPLNIDPYKCYRIKDTATGAAKFKKLDVQLVDEFGTTSTAVLKPFLLCNPSVESVPPSTPDNGGALKNPDAHMVCYKVRDRDTSGLHAPAGVETHVDFGDKPPPTITIQKIQVMKANLVCMPAAQLLPTPTKTRVVATPTAASSPTKTA